MFYHLCCAVPRDVDPYLGGSEVWNGVEREREGDCEKKKTSRGCGVIGDWYTFNP